MKKAWGYSGALGGDAAGGADEAVELGLGERLRGGGPGHVVDALLQHRAVDVVDTTGCGDVFHAAAIAARLRGLEPRPFLRFANAAAALATRRLGARGAERAPAGHRLARVDHHPDDACLGPEARQEAGEDEEGAAGELLGHANSLSRGPGGCKVIRTASTGRGDMTDDLALRRRFFAEEIEALGNLRTPGLVEALARVPREKFLGPGPWVVRSESDVGAPARQTPDADPRRVYHNLSVAIDAARQLFNGQPSLLCTLVDALGLQPGARVLHVGCGAGYYSALMASVVGPAGQIVAVDVDETLAASAARNLADWPWCRARHGDGTDVAASSFDAILVNAGVTDIGVTRPNSKRSRAASCAGRTHGCRTRRAWSPPLLCPCFGCGCACAISTGTHPCAVPMSMTVR